MGKEIELQTYMCRKEDKKRVKNGTKEETKKKFYVAAQDRTGDLQCVRLT